MFHIAGILENSIVDGPGIRMVVFCQGCPHHCPGCQNESTWPFEGGRPMDAQTLFAMAEADPLVRGVTFSGGEPFCQAEDFARLATLLHSAPRRYEVACYTGYTFEALLSGTPAQQALLRELDILVDGPFREAERSLELAFRGSMNQRILNVPQSLVAGRAVWEASRRWMRDEQPPAE